MEKKTVTAIIIETMSVLIAGKLFDQIWGCLTNTVSSKNFPINEFWAIVGLIFFGIACILGTILVVLFFNYRKQKKYKIRTQDDDLDELIHEIEELVKEVEV